MANLLDLPNELLSQILAVLVSECLPFSAPSLALSRRIWGFLRPLYIKIVGLDLIRNPAECDLFLRSLKENPELQSMVHVIRIHSRGTDGNVHERVNDILEILPQLRELYIRTGLSKTPFVPRFLEINSMKYLRKIDIFDLGLTIDNLQRYMVLSHAEHFVIFSKLRGSLSQSTDLIDRTSPLLTLDFDWAHHIPTGVLRDLLKLCPRIKKLRCALPGNGILGQTSDVTREMITPLSPLELSEALASARESLQELEFRDCGCFWPDPPNSRMDLSMMRSLKSVKCPAQCFFLPGRPYSSRNGLYKLLPASLEKLTLYFSLSRGLVCWYDSVGELADVPDHHEEFLWLLELATNKAKYVPHLKALCLHDQSGRRFELSNKLWDSPPRGTDSFSFYDAKIYFQSPILLPPNI